MLISQTEIDWYISYSDNYTYFVINKVSVPCNVYTSAFHFPVDYASRTANVFASLSDDFSAVSAGPANAGPPISSVTSLCN